MPVGESRQDGGRDVFERVPDRVAWPRLALLGFFMLFMGNGGVVTGQQYLPSGLAAVLIATTPFWMTSIDAMLRGGKQLHARQWAGLLLGLFLVQFVFSETHTAITIVYIVLSVFFFIRAQIADALRSMRGLRAAQAGG